MNMKKYVVATIGLLGFAVSAAPIIKSGEKIAFMGDSITQFGAGHEGGYVNLVIDGLSIVGVKAGKIPAGVSGHKSDQMLARLDGVLAKKPDWMTLSCGVNDVGHGPRGIELEPYKTNITAILDKCAAAGVKVIVLTPTLCNDAPGWKNHGYNRKLDKYCEFLRKSAAERNLPLADLNEMHKRILDSADCPKEGVTNDRLHMNNFGNLMMAKGVLQAMGLTEEEIARCENLWRARRRTVVPLANKFHTPENLVTLDTWETLKHRANMKGVSVDKYVLSKIEDRTPDLDWRKNRYETEELRLAAPAAEGFHGRVCDLERIDGANAAGDENCRTWKASAWRNERVNGQLVLWTKNPLEQVRVKVSALKGSNGEIPASAVSARFVRYVTASYLHWKADAPRTRFVGDILDDVQSLSMPSNSFRPVWLTVKVPQSAASGTYRGSVSVVAAGGGKIDFPVEIDVVAQTLPEPKDWAFFLDLWQHPWAVARYHGVKPFSTEHYALMKPLWEELAAAGQKTITTTITDLPWNHQNFDPYHSMVRHVKRADGSFKRDFSQWDEYVDFCIKCGLGPQIHCYTMATWGHIVYWEDEATGDIVKAKLVPGTPEHEAFWGPFLTEFRDHVKAKGLLGRVYIALDERSREELYATANLIEKRGKGLKLAMAGNKKPSEFAGISVDNYCQSLGHVSEDYLTEVHATRPSDRFTSTFYVCCGPMRPNTFVDSPLAESSWIGIFAAAKRMDGFLRWAYANWPRDPFVDSTFGLWRPGDTYLVYPGVRTSSRWEMLRDGIETFEKIRLLRAQGRSDAALETALSAIDFNVALKQDDAALAKAVADVMSAVDAASRKK